MGYLLEAQYLLFWPPILLSMLVMLTMGMTGIGSEGVDTDHDLDVDHDIDIDHDHDMEHDHGHADHVEDGLVARALSVLGLGKVPLSIVLTSFCMVWGVVGFACNQIFESMSLPAVLYVWFSIGIALVVATTITGAISRMIASIMPKTETYAATPADMVGKRGTVEFTVTDKSGQVSVRDANANLLSLAACVEPGHDSIAAHENVIVMSYDSAMKKYVVAPHVLH